MTGGSEPRLTRRELLKASLIVGGARLVGLDKIVAAVSSPPNHLESSKSQNKDPFQGGKQLGVIDFVGEPWVPLERVLGAELDGRLYTDLSGLMPEQPVTPTKKFYIRTRASELLESQKPWLIKVRGLVRQPLDLTLERLEGMVKPAGLHLMECVGNARVVHFGMLSVADWTGVPLAEILDIVKVEPQATRVLISGFDSYSAESTSSMPGASWIFTLEKLKSTKAFLATEMNGQPIPKDHGAPVRLVVPGWYGCTCIKWVDEIILVDDNVPASSQMQEFATRTYQTGVPSLARDYRPASIEQSAIPIRVEKWLVDGKIRYRVVGIVWGGPRPVNVLEIRFNPEEDYIPVDGFKQSTNDRWSFWAHRWAPKKPDTYSIRLRVGDRSVPTRRLDSGYFVRSVAITEV